MVGERRRAARPFSGVSAPRKLSQFGIPNPKKRSGVIPQIGVTTCQDSESEQIPVERPYNGDIFPRMVRFTNDRLTD